MKHIKILAKQLPAPAICECVSLKERIGFSEADAISACDAKGKCSS